MGFFIGLLTSFGIVLGAFDGTLQFGFALGLVFYSLLGLVFPRTIGTSLSIIQAGSAVGLIVALFLGNFESLISCIVIFLVAFAGQHFIVATRPNASASVGATSPFRTKKEKRTISSQYQENFDSELWDDFSGQLEYPEIALGQVLVMYKVKNSAISDWQRTFLARFTDEAIFLNSPDDFSIVNEIDFVFEENQRIPFSAIDQLAIVTAGVNYTEFVIRSESNKLNVNLEVDSDFKSDLLMLVKVWDCRNAINKFSEIYRATGDSRFEIFKDLVKEPLNPSLSSQCKKVARAWKSITNTIRPHLFNDYKSFAKPYSKLNEFASSNEEQLRALVDPRRLFRVMFPLLRERQSLLYDQLFLRLANDFEKSLFDLEPLLKEFPEVKPENFDDLVKETRELLSLPRAKDMFANVTGYVERRFYD